MRHGQRFGYMILGAAIMLIGLGIGAIVSPPLIAQKPLGRIKCTGLTVVNGSGQAVIALDATPNGGNISVMGKTENIRAILTAEDLPALYLVDEKRKGRVSLLVKENGGSVLVQGSREGKMGLLGISKNGPLLLVSNGEGKGEVLLHIYEGKGTVSSQ